MPSWYVPGWLGELVRIYHVFSPDGPSTWKASGPYGGLAPYTGD